MEDEGSSERGKTDGVTRRDLLARGAVTGFALSAGGLLAACGANGTAPSPKATGIPKKGGVLRVGLPAGSSADTLDPNRIFAIPDYCRTLNLYDGFCYPNAQFTGVENRLAEEFTHNAKADEWTLRLKPGVEFHNGKTLTADDAIFSVKRILDPKETSPGRGLLGPVIDPKGITKLDARTVRFKLLRPYADLPTLFANWTTCYVVPVGFDPKKPVGTGPFKFGSFAPGNNSVFTAFDNHWGGRPYLDQLVFTDLTDDTARLNALLGGQVDVIASVPFASIPTVKANSGLQLLEVASGAWFPLEMNCQAAPFNDVRVRQAFRLLADRKQMLDQAYLGHGVVGNDLYSIDDPDYARFPQRQQDVAQAKSLLRAAGRENDTFQLTVANLGPGCVEYSTSFAAQANAAGVKVTLNKIDPSVYGGPNYLKWPLADSEWPNSLGYLTQVALTDGPRASYPETHFGDNDPQFASLYYQAIRTVDPAKRRELEHEMQQIQYERGGYLVWGFQNMVDAASTKVAGFALDKSGWPLGSANFKHVHFV
ncbi:MAG: putative peptide transporter,substrate-binding protein [Conexibacter sp.]|nr:putative peptide transporter,substrate-binding protein [Conexibacter sp.]